MNIQTLRAIVCGIGLLLVPVLRAQESSSTPAPEETPRGFRRFSFGFRVAGYPFNPMHNKTENFTTTQSVPATYQIQTTNNYLKVGFGPSVEFAVKRRFTLVGELFYHRLNYTETTQISQGTSNTGITENTRTTFWDVPVMLRFHGLRDEGVLSHIYFNAGGAFRDATNIKSNIVTNNPNGTTTTSNTPIRPSATSLGGAVVGSGLRFVDDFGIKVEPELRYTRWFGRTFASDSTRSSPNQLEVSLAFTF
jgi:hypothetical protein